MRTKIQLPNEYSYVPSHDDINDLIHTINQVVTGEIDHRPEEADEANDESDSGSDDAPLW